MPFSKRVFSTIAEQHFGGLPVLLSKERESRSIIPRIFSRLYRPRIGELIAWKALSNPINKRDWIVSLPAVLATKRRFAVKKPSPPRAALNRDYQSLICIIGQANLASQISTNELSSVLPCQSTSDKTYSSRGFLSGVTSPFIDFTSGFKSFNVL